MSGAVGLLAEITLDQFGSGGLSTPAPTIDTTSSSIGPDCPQKASKGIMNFSKADLLRLLGLLEAELQARELVIVSLKAERSKLLRPAGSQKRYTVANPYSALGRDLDGNGNSSSNNNISSSGDGGGGSSGPQEEGKEEGCGEGSALTYLDTMVAKHKKAEAEMKTQLASLKESHAKMITELDEEKRKHASDTAQGDDVTYMLEKERERLAQQLDFEKAQQKKLERETKRTQSALVQERRKHLQFAKVILEERKALLLELGSMRQRTEELEDLLVVKDAQLASAKACLLKERRRLATTEAGLEERLAELDTEREQLRARLRREDGRAQQLREELDVANNSINDLQLALAEARQLDASNGNHNNTTGVTTGNTNGGEVTGKPLGRVTGSPKTAAKSTKIGTPRAIRTPPRYDKSEGSSSGSEELCSPMSPVVPLVKPVAAKPQKMSNYQPHYGASGKPSHPGQAADARSGESEPGRGDPRAAAKQKGSLMYTKGNGKTLSPATSLDRLNRANTSSPPPQRGSKIPSSTGSAARSSFMSPQQNRKGSGEFEKPGIKQPSSAPAPKGPATNLVRPTALSGSPFLKAVDAFKSTPKKVLAPGLPGSQSSVAFHPPSKTGSPSVPKAAVQPLLSSGSKKPQGQVSKPPTPTGQPLAVPTSKVNPTSPSSAAGSVSPGIQPAKTGAQHPPAFAPPAKRTVSPRGTPPPVPPNKPTLIPQKTNASSSSSCTSTTTVTSPTLALPAADTSITAASSSSKSPCPTPVSVRRSDSLVEARRQFYTNKLSGGQTNSRGPADGQPPLISANHNANNSNAIDTLAIDTISSDDQLFGPPPPGRAQDPPTQQRSTTQVGEDRQSGLNRSGSPPMHSDHGIYHNTLGPRHEGSAPVIARLPPSTAPSTSPLHQAAVAGDTATICRLIEENHSPNCRETDGSTPVQAAAEHGQVDCLELLLDLGGDPSLDRTDGVGPLHSAAGQGHSRCLSVLLDRHCDPRCPDSLAWQPLHWAAANGHLDSVRLLLDHGVPRDCLTKGGWTPLHCATKYNQTHCLQALLYHADPATAAKMQPDHTLSCDRMVSCDLLNQADQEGWTVAHVGASTGQKECLELLCNYGNLDLDSRDKWRRTPMDLAVDASLAFLSSLEAQVVLISIELPINASSLLSSQRQEAETFVIGQLTVRPGMSWTTFDRCVAAVLSNHSRDMEGWSRIKADQESEGEDSSDASLGLSARSIRSYSAGNFHWAAGQPPQGAQPQELFASVSEITVHLCGIDVGRLDQLAYQTLIPVVLLQNYVRLIEQYKSVVFYGPAGTGKTILASQLAEFVKMKHQQMNIKSAISHIGLHAKISQQDLTKQFCSKGILFPASDITPPKTTPILLLDSLDKTTPAAGVLADLLKGLERRGSQHAGQLSPPQGSGLLHLHPDCIVICTMDKTSSVLDLSAQHCFRWVQLHHDREPVASTLPRYLLRRVISRAGGRLPPARDPAYRAVEWICRVWQRLNDCLVRLKLKNTVLGPKHFCSCPVDSEGPNSVFRWFCLSWNHAIAPQIEDILRRKASASTNAHNYQRLVSTTLYVLLQRAVFPGCPFTGEEADDYMASFRGVNELLAQLSSQRTNSLKRSPRRSKSLDRSKTSNKAALMASKQQAALDLDSAQSDGHRSTRSMIPRRVPKSHSKAATSDSNSNPINPSQPDQNLSSPLEDTDLLESLLQLQGCPLDTDADRLTQLQENLLARRPGPAHRKSVAESTGGSHRHSHGHIQMTSQSHSPSNGSQSQGHSQGQSQTKRPSPEGAASLPGQREKAHKRSRDEEGTWDVWEETV